MIDARVNARYEYEQMIERLRQTVRYVLPAESRLLVISRGDDELLQLAPCKASHFPQSPSGGYAGYYPADSGAAIAHLDFLQKNGAEFLVIPRSSFWWLTHYREFAQYLETQCHLVHRHAMTDAIFALCQRDLTNLYTRTQLENLLSNLLPLGSRILVAGQESIKIGGMLIEQFPITVESSVTRLEELRATGAKYLVIPYPSSGQLEAQLNGRYRCLMRQQYLCVVFSLDANQ